VGHEDLLRAQQVEDELLVVDDRVDLGVEAGEAVERPLRLDTRDARDVVEQLGRQLALLVERSAR
jgi:hypothetical protein